MKLSINRNIVWSDIFVNRLAQLGVHNACISPGSRNTSLTLAFNANRHIKIYQIVDERSSAFFALGLAKKTNSPVAVLTTSGTAVAELYPAIIEAYYSRVPLIICTADRPYHLLDRGANQTINQINIYKNHIRYFKDAGLPDINKLSFIKQVAEEAIHFSTVDNRGPVHINLPFEKPFEPKSYTDSIELKKIENIFTHSSFETAPPAQSSVNFESLSKKLLKKEKGLIIVGYNNYSDAFSGKVIKLAEKLGYPVYADGASSLRLRSRSKNIFIDNLTAFMRGRDFQKHFDPKIIIQFGAAPTSNVLLEFFKNSKAEKILVNDFGDRKDPSLTAKTIIRFEPAQFCSLLADSIKEKGNRDSCWKIDMQVMNSFSGDLKSRIIDKAKFPFEGKIVSEIIDAIPARSNLFVSNSMPIRDTDFFVSANRKKIKLFCNRGASGIDGINSTAIGIAARSKEKTFLIIGDLAFYHDLNGLLNSVKFKIPLTIILINNSGGGIFESLPISRYRDGFTENFSTPLNLDFEKIVKAYGGKYFKINSWKNLKEKVILSSGNRHLSVLEIRTDAKKSKLQRNKYWNAVSKRVVRFINETKS